MNILIYDCEIVNCIPARDEPKREGINYCQGWGDHEGMGVSVIAAYEWDRGYRIFMADNFAAFKALVEAQDTLCVGFNNRVFDDVLVSSCLGVIIPVNRSWDLMRVVRRAQGKLLSGVSDGPSLHSLCMANGLPGKSGQGAMAPILWQQGKIGEVTDYCLNDVIQTQRLMELVMAGRLRDPDSGRILFIPPPAFS